MAHFEYPEITALDNALVDHDMRLTVEPEDARLRTRSYRRIRLTLVTTGKDWSVPVDDEYDDASSDNPALMLHLVLSECDTHEDAEDFLVWARDTGFDPSAEWVRALYAEIGTIVPEIREAIGSSVQPLSSYDFTLNAGAARALRDRAR